MHRTVLIAVFIFSIWARTGFFSFCFLQSYSWMSRAAGATNRIGQYSCVVKPIIINHTKQDTLGACKTKQTRRFEFGPSSGVGY